ncbi:hypothetical protein M3C94_005285, partial [Micrococcus luteus]|nr:hypothetical protein [Micrococcus luteus]MCV7725315.1 hypothetical protein [Micrococcus luteus]
RGLSRQGGHPPPLGPEMDDGPDAGHGVTVNMVGTGAEPSRTPLHRCTDGDDEAHRRNHRPALSS